ncbi:hypothetical protein ACFU9B_31350 [Streptomyces sp. NPDC057592]|uniref:hypothetical protein n=1 Tax=unclassified Streptomyces TaxID=2593676 RepID=UPI0036B6557A
MSSSHFNIVPNPGCSVTPTGQYSSCSGAAHYFQNDDYADINGAAEYRVWPASVEALALEREQWAIYARWNERHEARTSAPDSHPGIGGIDARYDELNALLASHRQAPADARRLVAQWQFVADRRYQVEGVNCWVRWRPGQTAVVEQ